MIVLINLVSQVREHVIYRVHNFYSELNCPFCRVISSILGNYIFYLTKFIKEQLPKENSVVIHVLDFQKQAKQLSYTLHCCHIKGKTHLTSFHQVTQTIVSILFYIDFGVLI